MLVAVKPVIQLPHKVLIAGKHVSFEPAAEVPDEWGNVVCANKLAPYFAVTKENPVHEELYTWNDLGKNATMAEITKKASAEQFQAILAFARKTVYGEAKKAGSKTGIELDETEQTNTEK